MKKYGIIIVILSLLPLSVAAQDELYRQVDDDVIKDVAKKAVASRAQGNQKTKDFYMGIIRDAFVSYWRCLSPLSADSLDRLRAEVKQLEEQKKSLSKELKKNEGGNQNKDSLLLQQIEEFKQRKQIASESILQINASIDEIKKQLDDLAPTIEKIEKSQQMLEDKNREIETMAGNITELVGKCRKGSLLDVQLVEEMKSTLKSFDGAKTMMERINPDLYKEATNAIQTIKNYLDLSGALQSGISQMGKKFDKTKNLELVNTINKSRGSIQLSEAQKSDCDKIVAALTNQEEAYNYYKGLLEWVKEFRTIPDETSRDGCWQDLKEKMKKEETKRSSFSDYYTNLKKVIDGLSSEMSTKGFKKQSEPELKQYVNKKIEQL